jgi:hypothetical protein
MPLDLLDISAGTSATKGANQPGTLQLDGRMKLALAAARGEASEAEDSWGVMDLVFTHQTKAGDFGGSPTTAAFSLCELTRTLLVIAQSPLAANFKDRIEALKPAIANAARWLTGQRSRMAWEDRAYSDRLSAEAEAFLGCGRLLGDQKLVKYGQEFLAKAMRLNRASDGAFVEGNSVNPDCQAATLVRLQEIALLFPDLPIAPTIARAAQWETAQIGPDGAVHIAAGNTTFPGSKMLLGPPKSANIGEISLALLYFHERTGDPAALAAVERLHRNAAVDKR